MLFSYKAVDKMNEPRDGTVDATSMESAMETVKLRGYTIISIEPLDKSKSFFDMEFDWFQHVSNKEIVILSRQLATLFEAQVSALRIFRLLGAEAENTMLRSTLTTIADDLQGGSTISRALSNHPDIFSSFYVSMVKSGEESGTLDETFEYLAGYLDRMYQVISKAKNALIYPAFVIGIFILVMTLMLTMVIPKITAILVSGGAEVPIYTRVVIALSNILTDYIGIILIFIAVGGFIFWKFINTTSGKRALDEFKLRIPVLGNLYKKLYLTRICDNLATMLSSGISMVQALEVTAEVVDNGVYREILDNTIADVKSGKSFADSLSQYPEIPGVLSQMSKVGEETGNLGEILKTLATYYNREVNQAVDTMINLIEPFMIVVLGLGVGSLLAAVLIPIYNITETI